MLMIFCSLIVAIAVTYSHLAYKKIKELAPIIEEMKGQFKMIDNQQSLLNVKDNDYRLLKMKYEKDRRELKLLESMIQQHNIGVGTVDQKVFTRATDFNQLEELELKLSEIKEAIKLSVKNKKACVCALSGKMQVNGRKAEATKLINREIKLRIRCLDNEVDAAIALANWNNINRLIERVQRVFLEINAKGKIIQTQLQYNYLELKISELKLSYEIAQLKNDIKDAEREERNSQREYEREEDKIKAAVEKTRKDKERMEVLIQQELAKFQTGTEEQQAKLALHQEELRILQERENRAISMAQLTRAGYVYIISNELAFGPNIVKIGMTRRVDPYERVHELGDASVPDTFDVHAFFYCQDAPALESELHRIFSHQRVNLVNKRKEFFSIPFDKAIEAVTNSGIEVERTL